MNAQVRNLAYSPLCVKVHIRSNHGPSIDILNLMAKQK